MNYKKILAFMWAITFAVTVFSMRMTEIGKNAAQRYITKIKPRASLPLAMSAEQQKEALFKACANGDTVVVSRLIEGGFDINTRYIHGWTPLHIACDGGYKDLVIYLVGHGADIYAVDGRGFTPSRIAFDSGFRDIADYLIVVEDGLSRTEKKPKEIVQIKSEEKSLSVPISRAVVQVALQQQKVNQIQPKKLSKKEKKLQNKLQYAPIGQSTVIAPQKNVVAQMSPQKSANQVEPKKLSRKEKKNQNKITQAGKTKPAQSQNNNVKITRTDSSIHIYEYSNTPGYYTETILFRDCPNCPLPGVYYRTANGLNRVDGTLRNNNGVAMYNPLLDLRYKDDVVTKMHSDRHHGFSKKVENEAGPWARIIIKNAINDPNQIFNGTKKFKISVTIPGEINEVDNSAGKAIVVNRLSGVFEFTITKNLYEKKGECLHRFFAQKGIVGAMEFGAKARNKIMNQ